MFFFFFENFEEFLKNSLYSDESYERDKVFGSMRADFYLPKGSRRLNYPEKTVIEIKEKITSGTTRGAQAMANRLERDYGINRFVLISHNIPKDAIPLRTSRDKKGLFWLVDFEALRESIDKYGTVQFEDDNLWEKNRERLLSRAAYDYKQGRNTFFLGAGVSRGAGLLNWGKLLDVMVSKLQIMKAVSLNDLDSLKKDCGKDYLIKARFLKRICDERDVSFVDLVREALYSVVPRESKLVNAIVDCVASGKLESIITYNYDDILERELAKREIPYTSVDGQNRAIPNQFPLFHVHGFIPSEQDKSYEKNVVLSENEYHKLYNNTFHWSNIEQVHALVQTTCFFIGLSMKDPNLRRLLDVAQQRGSGDPVHYAFLRRGEYKQPKKAERIFYEMGVNVIWYNRHSQIPGLIRTITNTKTRKKSGLSEVGC